jgi:hypothetical protein
VFKVGDFINTRGQAKDEHIRIRFARKRIIAAATADNVCARTAANIIFIASTEQDVIALIALNLIITIIAFDVVRTFAT